ncbi:MAG: DNA-binding response regulator, partial [Peptostreptococcaceae bacterium]
MGKILLLEDDKSLNRGISFKLKKEGYKVHNAFNIKQAKELFIEN